MSEDFKTPLERAMEKGRKSELLIFLKSGLDPNLRDRKDNTLLYIAVKNNHPDLVDALMSFNANINLLNMGGEAVIHLSARLGNLKMCKLLISHGASLLAKNIRNQLPITIAIKSDFMDIVALFLDRMEGVNNKDHTGKYFWEYANNDSMKMTILKFNIWKKRVPLLFLKKYTKVYDKIPDGIFQSLVKYL